MLALLALLLAWIAAGLVLDSPRKEAERRVKAMAEALGEKNWDKFADNVSDRFAAGTMTKADLKKKFEQGAGYNVKASAWDFAVTDPPRVTDRTQGVARWRVSGWEGGASTP